MRQHKFNRGGEIIKSMALTQKIKDYLVAEELKKLEQEVDALKQIIIDKNEIVKRITPIIDNILSRKFLEDKEVLIQIFSEHISTILEQSSKKYPTRLRDSLHETITKNFEEEMKKNQDKMVDIMYPMLGSMVSKYVASAIKEMNEAINKKIEERIPYEYYKEKLLSKITGNSEAELLLAKENNVRIQAVFIIEKESGILICEEHLENKNIKDPYMVASMASAIKDFMNEWIETNQNHKSIEIVSYGDAVLYIENAGTVYMIAFLNSMPNEKLKRKIRKIFASILALYANSLQHFSGDDSEDFLQDVKKQLNTFLIEEIEEEEVATIEQPIRKEKWQKIPKLWKYLLLGTMIGGWFLLGDSNKIELPETKAITSFYKSQYQDHFLEAQEFNKPFRQNIWLNQDADGFDNNSLEKIKAMISFIKTQKNIIVHIVYFKDAQKTSVHKLVKLLKDYQIEDIFLIQDKEQKSKSFMLKYKIVLEYYEK